MVSSTHKGHRSSFSVESIVLEAEGEVVVCDTCGEQGWEKKKLAICKTCHVGAEHTYCMKVKRKKVPKEWDCYDCTEKKVGVRKGEENEEAGSAKRKAVSSIDSFETGESSQGTSSQGRPRSFKTPRLNDNVDLDLNVDPNLDQNRDPNMELGFDLNREPNLDLNMGLGFDLNRVPNLDLNLEPGFDLNRVPNLDLNMEPGFDLNRIPNLDLNMEAGLDLNHDPNLDLNMVPSIDLNLDPTIDLNVDPNIDVNLDLRLDFASSSSSNF